MIRQMVNTTSTAAITGQRYRFFIRILPFPYCFYDIIVPPPLARGALGKVPLYSSHRFVV